jgi:hypothetical protein
MVSKSAEVRPSTSNKERVFVEPGSKKHHRAFGFRDNSRQRERFCRILDNQAACLLPVVSCPVTKEARGNRPVCAKLQSPDFPIQNPATGSSNHRTKITEYPSSSKKARGVKDQDEAKRKQATSAGTVRLNRCRGSPPPSSYRHKHPWLLDPLFDSSFFPDLEERGDKDVYSSP